MDLPSVFIPSVLLRSLGCSFAQARAEFGIFADGAHLCGKRLHSASFNRSIEASYGRVSSLPATYGATGRSASRHKASRSVSKFFSHPFPTKRKANWLSEVRISFAPHRAAPSASRDWGPRHQFPCTQGADRRAGRRSGPSRGPSRAQSESIAHACTGVVEAQLQGGSRSAGAQGAARNEQHFA